MVQKRVTAQGRLGSTPEGQRSQIRGPCAASRGWLAVILMRAHPTLVTYAVGREGRHTPRPNDVGGQPRFPGTERL